nr:hypothetical protein [Candidatus Acidoferrales bacterium]
MSYPDNLIRVRTLEEIEALPPDTDGIFVRMLTDEKVQAIVARCPTLRILIVDGNNRTTDASFLELKKLQKLESLDLEWSAVTDAGLHHIAEMPSLTWIDLSFSGGVTLEGLRKLRREKPDLEIEPEFS